MFTIRPSRRNFLRAGALTSAGLALGLGSSLGRPSAARAGGMPRRILFCVTQHGFVQHQLRMTPTDALASAAPSRILTPLAPFFDRMLVVEGLSMNSAISDYWSTARNPHVPAHLHVLTGAAAAARTIDGSGGGPSVDQIIASALSAETPFASVEVGFSATSGGGLGLGAYNWAARDVSMPYVAEPAALYEYLFSTLPSPETPRGLDAIQGRLARFATDEHASLLSRFVGASAERLSQHRELLAALADRLEAPPPACDAPATPGASSSYSARYAAFGEVLAAAFACDLTRVATIAFDQQDPVECGGAAGGDLHNDYAHATTERNPTGGMAVADEVMANAATNHAGHVASLLRSLEAVREADGSSLLDHTLVVWTSELAVGRHDATRAYHGLPFILAGSNAHFRMGRYVAYPEDRAEVTITSPRGSLTDSVGPSHNHLLVSLCHAMGLSDVSSVGMESIPLGGTTLDATGGLEDLV